MLEQKILTAGGAGDKGGAGSSGSAGIASLSGVGKRPGGVGQAGTNGGGGKSARWDALVSTNGSFGGHNMTSQRYNL